MIATNQNQRALVFALVSFALASAAAQDPATGVVQGVVTFTGRIPPPYVAYDAGGLLRYKVLVDRKTGALKDAVIHLEPLDGQKLRAPAEKLPVVTVDQLNREFIPQIIALRTGQPVLFTNADGGNHNVTTMSFQDANNFNRFTTEFAPYTHRFVASKYPVKLSCSIHSTMWGWIYVFDHRYFALTDGRGRFRMRNILPGRYRLVLRHQEARVRLAREIKVLAGRKLQLRLVAQSRRPSARGL